jgi:tetratricopeptide (TPR) repeat protein
LYLEVISPANQLDIVNARNALKRGEWLAALVHIKAYTAADPGNVEAQELLGIALAQNGDRHAAMKVLSDVVEINPGRASGHYNLALLLNDDNMLDEAMEEVQAALYIKPDHAGARTLRETLAKRLKDRYCRSDENFAVVESHFNPLTQSSEEWAKILCVSCGAMNFITARTCSRCGSYLPEDEELEPVE